VISSEYKTESRDMRSVHSMLVFYLILRPSSFILAQQCRDGSCIVPLPARTTVGFPTQSFQVTADDMQTAQAVALAAERVKKQQALEWFGHEQHWEFQHPITVTIRAGDPYGASTFAFENGRVIPRGILVQGPWEKLLHDVVPHEITHCVLANHFKRPLPRWFDEGAAIKSESLNSRTAHGWHLQDN